MVETEQEIAVLRAILSKSRGPTWWARLSYPQEKKYWTPTEQEVLARAFGKETTHESSS